MRKSVRLQDRLQAGSYGCFAAHQAKRRNVEDGPEGVSAANNRRSYKSGSCLKLASILFQGSLVVAELHHLFEIHFHEGADGTEHFVLVDVAEFMAVEPGGFIAFDDVEGMAKSETHDLAT